MRKTNKIILTNDGSYNQFSNTGPPNPEKAATFQEGHISEKGMIEMYNERIIRKIQNSIEKKESPSPFEFDQLLKKRMENGSNQFQKTNSLYQRNQD